MFENLTHAPFILASYAIAFTLLGGIGIASWIRARKMEAKAEDLKAKAPTRQRRRAK